jgi:two-component system, NtrC family, nitrogen regulation response regulator NtrX
MTKYKVLLVDDEAEIRECLQSIAQHSDLEFTHAPNGEEGLKLILEQAFDCVVSDIKMPRMTGLEMLMAARAQGRDVPMVFVSAFANDGLCHDLSNYGAVKLLHKLDLLKARECIQEAIELGHELKAIHKNKDAIGEDFIQILHRTTGVK